MPVDLDTYIFPIIEYDPTEKSRGVVTADEWNTILNLLKTAVNYTNKSLQDIVADLYTATELSSKTLGEDGSRLVGVDVIPGVTGNNVNEVLRNLKEQLDAVVLGSLPDHSVTAEKLAPNQNFTGTSLTFNNVNILTENEIVTELTDEATDTQVPSAKATYDTFVTKQDVISIGTAAPTNSTPGNIYLQYIS